MRLDQKIHINNEAKETVAVVSRVALGSSWEVAAAIHLKALRLFLKERQRNGEGGRQLSMTVTELDKAWAILTADPEEFV